MMWVDRSFLPQPLYSYPVAVAMAALYQFRESVLEHSHTPHWSTALQWLWEALELRALSGLFWR
jgi:hypothetical protein